MSTRDFEIELPFREVTTGNGDRIHLPLVAVKLLQPGGGRVLLPLLFDTGASVTTLSHNVYTVLGLPSWDVGERVEVGTAGGPDPVVAYKYQADLEFLGKPVNCPVHLQPLPPNPLYVGLLGREQFFEAFGFGFWESERKLFVTTAP